MCKRGFHISVAQLPLIPAKEESWDTYLDYLKNMQADRVFISAPYDNICRITPEVKSRYGNLFAFQNTETELYTSNTPDGSLFRLWSAILKEKIEFFKSNNIETAFWMGHTIGHGGNLSASGQASFQQLVGPDGVESRGCFCPLDEGFRRYLCDALAAVASSGVGLILLDDDFRLNNHGSELPVGCFCPLHLKRFGELTGKEWSREELKDKIFCGKPGQLRARWLEAAGGSLMEFAASIEKAVHDVSPQTRIGLATAMSLWSNEGIDMHSLLLQLAGDTKPFLRMLGAPYWSKEPYHAGWIVEYTRLQAQWMAGKQVELLAEGDTFPHTRFHCSAAMLHAFQQGLLVSGINRIMNYAFLFTPPPEHETGYVIKTAQALENYQAISGFFPADYEDVGLNIIYKQNSFTRMTLPDSYSGTRLFWPDEPVTLKYLSRLSIPVAYNSGTGATILAGYTPESIPDEELSNLLLRGLILDAVAADCLMKRGVDIGINQLCSAPVPKFEHFSDREFSGRFFEHDVWLLANGGRTFKRMEPKEGARIISGFSGNVPTESFPSVLLYENNDGCRFCIYGFDFYEARNSQQLLYSYARQEQLIRCIDWVGRHPLAVSVCGYPDLHLICRRSQDGKRLAAAVQNLSLDTVVNPMIRLGSTVRIGKSLELLLPEADKPIAFNDFMSFGSEGFQYIELNTKIPPMGLLAIGFHCDATTE